jgi:hypothetical protein
LKPQADSGHIDDCKNAGTLSGPQDTISGWILTNRMKRRDNMRQKYIISREDAKNRLKIREYSVIGRKLNNLTSSMLRRESFSFLCEEFYERETIEDSISKGMRTLVASLRTHNMFPIEPYANKIAESVMALYNSSEESSVELIFNDADLISA